MLNTKLVKTNNAIFDYIKPEFRRIKEDRDRRIREQKEKLFIDHFSTPSDIEEFKSYNVRKWREEMDSQSSDHSR
jgi:hypothetical protein